MERRARIGYMGIPFSNSDGMSQTLAEQAGLKDAEQVPLMSAKGVMEALEAGAIDYGVLAVSNTLAGEVEETADACKGAKLRIVAEGDMPIHHCVFARVHDGRITKVCSHVQALRQCTESLKRLYPDAVQIDCADTAYAAEMLAEGKLPEDCAVLCRKAAGEHYGLRLAHENIEDSRDNVTHFVLVRL